MYVSVEFWGWNRAGAETEGPIKLQYYMKYPRVKPEVGKMQIIFSGMEIL